MAGEFLAPSRAGELPQIGVILQAGNLLGGKAGDAGFQQLQQILGLIAPLHRLEGPQHKPGDGLAVHLGGLGHKAGDVPLFQGGVQAAVVPGGVPADDGDFPVAVALLRHQAADGGRGELRLLVGVLGLQHGDALAIGAGERLLGAEKLGLHQL